MTRHGGQGSNRGGTVGVVVRRGMEMGVGGARQQEVWAVGAVGVWGW